MKVLGLFLLTVLGVCVTDGIDAMFNVSVWAGFLIACANLVTWIVASLFVLAIIEDRKKG